MSNCAALCRSPEIRRVGSALSLLVLVQAAGLLTGPLLLSWRVNLLWGGHDDLKLLGSLVLATIIGSLAVTLWMNRKIRASSGERVFVISASVCALPLLVGIYYTLIGLVHGSVRYWCGGLFVAGWIIIPILLSLPLAHAIAWSAQLVIDRIWRKP